jgi:hypothetical protein
MEKGVKRGLKKTRNGDIPMVNEVEEKTEERSKIIVHIKRDEEELKTGPADDSSVGSLEVEVLSPTRDDKACDERKVRVIIKATDNFGYANGENTNENETQ